MFTGIVTHLGKIKNKQDTSLAIEAPLSLIRELKKGTSIAVNGACLTVLAKPVDTSFTVEVMPETLSRTMLGKLNDGDQVNLELSVTPVTLLSGHIVQGHIDGVGIVKKIKEAGNSKILTINIPKSLSKYIVEKGSIAVNGISLTVIEARDIYFTVGIIPYTWTHTMIKDLKIRDQVNIETDILAKYLEKLVTKR